MRVGAFYFPADYGINMAELAKALEDRGFDSLFVPEHTHIPASRKSPFPGGGELPKRYSHTHDPFVALAFAAAATKKLKLGTGILLVPQHEPIVTAKAIASLDQLSGGRFIFGIGGGWNVEEMENHGATYQTRFKQMREHVLAMKELWTKEEASFDGEFVKFDRVWSWPKPAQQPHPPIILGGETDHTLRRVIEYCDGWFPRPRGGFDVVKGVAHLRQMAEKAGRDPSTITTIVFGSANDAKVLESYDKAGIQSALLAIPDDSRDEILRYLDKIAPLAKVALAA
ncbi:MAG TPA: TIGR03619 family F420-dependent LLM class oxidoreductase [Reyranella sp.]|jgi:probable F420-dependent oxidoreductase|nr:TIGR03619 family F420-dependent LLM class oxidoreductase [Reyranella sp.]